MLFSLRQVILISSFLIVNLLWCRDNFSNKILIQKSLSLGSFLVLYNHIRTSLGRRRACPLELHVRPYVCVLITYTGDVLKTSVWDILGVTFNTRLGCPQDVQLEHPQDVIFNVLRTSVEDALKMSDGNALGT